MRGGSHQPSALSHQRITGCARAGGGWRRSGFSMVEMMIAIVILGLGMLMAATALLRTNPAPSEAQVREGLGGVLCRCTGYHNIVKSVLDCASKSCATQEVQA